MEIQEVLDENSIRIIDIITAIRSRPHLYIGNPQSSEIVNLLLQETLCIAIDKVQNQCSNEIIIEIENESLVTVRDNGFPIGLSDYKGEKLIEVLLTKLLACQDLKPSADLCKIGIVVANAFSEYFQYNCADGEYHWQCNFEFGNPIESIQRKSQSKEIFEQFTFFPDKSLIPNSRFQLDLFETWLLTKNIPNNCKISIYEK